MERRIRDRYSGSILSQALDAYGIKPEDIQELDGFESFIYEFNRGAERGILRISHSIRRTPELIQGELDWVNYLDEGGVQVARSIPTFQGERLKMIDDGQGGWFMAAAFEWAPGVTHQDLDWPESLIQEYGRQIGRMHHLAVLYQPHNPDWKRAEWHDPLNLEIDRFLPRQDHKILKIYQDLKDHLHRLPLEREGYGLIHQDPHPGNFHVDENGKITFFDFDDCAYGWYVNDLALVLFYTTLGQEEPDRFITDFLGAFLPAYFNEFNLDPKWFKEIAAFQKLRELDLYALIHRSFDLDHLDPWCEWYMAGRKERLENEVPFLDFDFGSLDLKKYR